MDLKTQYIILGTLYKGKYTFDPKTNVITNTLAKKPLKGLWYGKKLYYRFILGYDIRVEAPCDEVHYLLNYGVYNPGAKVLHKDEDPLNNSKENLTLSIQGNEIPNDVKKKIVDLFAKGKGYAEIGRTVSVNRQTVKQIVKKHYGEVHPRQYVNTKLLVDSMRRDMNGFRL